MADIKITEQQADALLFGLLEKKTDDIVLDDKKFFDLLKHSLSLNTQEKKRVFDAVPTLIQLQFDKLIQVFEDERVKFKDLAKQHPEDIKKLLAKQQKEWLDLGDIFQAQLEAEKKGEQDQGKIDDIKSSLGL